MQSIKLLALLLPLALADALTCFNAVQGCGNNLKGHFTECNKAYDQTGHTASDSIRLDECVCEMSQKYNSW